MLRDMSTQLQHCQDTLGALLSYGRTTFDSGLQSMALDVFVREILDAFGARRPAVPVTLRIDTAGRVPSVRHDLALRQGILNLLGNAADVSPAWVE